MFMMEKAPSIRPGESPSVLKAWEDFEHALWIRSQVSILLSNPSYRRRAR